MTNELLEFESGVRGLALNLDVREVGVVVLGDYSGIEEGQQVRRTGEVLSVPVGDGYLGRVVDPLGNPIDGAGPITTTGRRAWSCRPRPWSSGSRCTSRCRPASRPSTP
jgi:F-type H+-transporting ATPase subunit alpha